MKHGRSYKIHVSFPKLQIEGACEINGKVKSLTINENCSIVETSSEYVIELKNINDKYFLLDSSFGVVKIHFSHVPDGWMVQTGKVDTQIKIKNGIVKLFDLSEGRRISGRLNEYNKFLFLLISNYFLLDESDVNDLIHHSFHKINKDVAPVVEKVLEHHLKHMATKLFDQFSYGQLFPL